MTRKPSTCQLADLLREESRRPEPLLEDLHVLLSSHLSGLAELARHVSHEVNNPLTVILGRARQIKKELLKPSPDAALALSYCDIIATTAKGVAAMIVDMKAAIREAEQEAFVDADTDFHRLLGVVHSLVVHRLTALGIVWLVPNDVSELRLRGREAQLLQVLLALVSNSCDALGELSDRWIKIEAGVKGERELWVAVTDSGCGIPHAIQDSLFKPPYIAKNDQRGRGFGLSVAKGIIESQGGMLSLDLESQHTRFVVTLPRHKAVLG